MAKIQTFDEYIKENYSEWLKLSAKHLSRVIDPRECGRHVIPEQDGVPYGYFCNTLTLQNLVSAIKNKANLDEVEERNIERIKDNYSIVVFSHDSDFAKFCDSLRQNFPANAGFSLSDNPKRGQPYSGLDGSSFLVCYGEFNPPRAIGVISTLDEWPKNKFLVRYHERDTSLAKDFVIRVAENVIKNSHSAQFGFCHPSNSLTFAFHDLNWKK